MLEQRRFSSIESIVSGKCVIFLGILYGIIFFSLSVLMFRSFFSFEWEDDAAEIQVIYNIADSFSAHQTIFLAQYFVAHFKPIYFLVAVFYKFFPCITSWFFLVSFSYGLCAYMVFLLAKDKFGPSLTSVLVSLVYLLYAPLHFATLGALDSNQLVLPLLFVVIYAVCKRQFVLFCIMVVLASFCKVDIPIIIFSLGIYLLIKKFPMKWWVTAMVYSVVYGLFSAYFSAVFCQEKNLLSSVQDQNFFYLDGPSISAVFHFFVASPDKAFASFCDVSHLRVFGAIFVPLLGLPCLSLFFYIPWVMFFEIILETPFQNHDSYYLAPLIPFIFMGYIEVLGRLRNNDWRNVLLVVSLLLGVWGLFSENILGETLEPSARSYIGDGRFRSVRNLFDARIYTADADDHLAWSFIRMIPEQASVTASGDLLPALSSRKRLYEFALTHPDARFNTTYSLLEYPSYDADYVLIHRNVLSNGLSGHYAFLKEQDLDKEIERLCRSFHYQILREEGGFILLQKSRLHEDA